MSARVRSMQPPPRGPTKRQFWISLGIDTVSCLLATALLIASQEFYRLKMSLITRPPKRMLLLEVLSASFQSVALTLWCCLAWCVPSAPLVDRVVLWLVARLVAWRGLSVVLELEPLTQVHPDSESDAEMDGATTEEVPVRDPAIAASQPRRRQTRGLSKACGVLMRVVTHPLSLLTLFAYLVSYIYCTAHDRFPSAASMHSQELAISSCTAILSLLVVPVCVAGFIWRTITRCLAAEVASRPTANAMRLTFIVIFSILALLFVRATLIAYLSVNTIEHMSLRALGGHEDFCGGVGRHTNKTLASALVWPAVVPSWLRGEQQPKVRCGADRHHRPLSYLDRETNTLVVSTRCWQSKLQPRVFLERPNVAGTLRRNRLYKGLYRAYVEDKYGTDEKAHAAGVVVRRDPKDKSIQEVELDPRLLTPVRRARDPRGSRAAAVRAHWKEPDAVLEVALGASASYTVRCPAIDAKYDELYLYPLSPAARGSSDAIRDTRRLPTASHVGVDEPPGSVLFILIDALSRQEMVRSLPLFNAWMRDFRARQARKARSTGFVVAEPLHHSTVGLSSVDNIGPMLCSAPMSALKHYFGEDRTRTRPQAPNETIFYEFKARYGETVETTLTTTACFDIIGVDCDTPPLSGSGHATDMGGVDRHLYFPFCDDEYSYNHYAAMPHCLDGRSPAGYTYDYVNDLLRQRARLSQQNASRPHFFLDMVYFLEAHEVSQTVLGRGDRQLRDFMEHLEKDLHFFDNPLNALVFGGDHGLHYGSYLLSEAGQLERTTPAMLFAFHPDMMRRVDAMKNRTEGTSLANFERRLRGFNSQLDLQMTLRDILGIPDLGLRLYENNVIKPTSYFDARDAVPEQCTDFRGTAGDQPTCALDYCTK